MLKNIMMKFEKYKGRKTRHTCPQCEKKFCFTRYVDEAGEYIADNVGRCDHENSCGYHYKPKDYFIDNNFEPPQYVRPQTKPKPKPKPSFIEQDILGKSAANYHKNNFVKYLNKIFDPHTVNMLIQKYFIGTSKRWDGATVFWQIDANTDIHTGKIMLYNASNGRRVKGEQDYISWVHSALRIPDFNLEQCLFGEHLLNQDKYEYIGLCESEKTAVIAAGFYPEWIWMATGGKRNNFGRAKKILKNKNVALFPDVGCVELWRRELPFDMCNLKLFKGKSDGYDLADLLTN